MKTIRNVLLVSMLLFAFSCEKSNDVEGIEEPQAVELNSKTAEIENHILEKGGEEALKRYLDNRKNNNSNVARIVDPQLCPDEVTYGTNFGGTDFYSFYAVAGSNVIIDVTRIDCGFDAYGRVYGPGFDEYRDDTVPPPASCASSCYAYWDPQWNFVAPNTGFYTLEVFEAISCSAHPWDYQITASGIVCIIDSDGDGIADDIDNCPDTPNADQANNDGDAEGDACDPDDDNDGVLDVNDNCQFTYNPGQANYDGDSEGDVCDDDDDNDGCPDDDDLHPFSIQSQTVVIGGCDTGVANQALGCSTMADILMDCCLNSNSQFSYIRCVNETTTGWMRSRLITRSQQRAISQCASRNYGNCSYIYINEPDR